MENILQQNQNKTQNLEELIDINSIVNKAEKEINKRLSTDDNILQIQNIGQHLLERKDLIKDLNDVTNKKYNELSDAEKNLKQFETQIKAYENIDSKIENLMTTVDKLVKNEKSNLLINEKIKKQNIYLLDEIEEIKEKLTKLEEKLTKLEEKTEIKKEIKKEIKEENTGILKRFLNLFK